MTRVALLAVDLDGTLLTSAETLAPLGSHLLAQAARRGIQVVLSTARTVTNVRTHCEVMNLTGPMICTNGAQVLAAPDGPLLADHVIPRAAALELAQIADQKDWELMITVGEVTYWRQRPGQSLGLQRNGRMTVRTNAEMVTGDPVRMLAWQPEAIQSLRAVCAAQFADACRTEIYADPDDNPESLGILPQQADKATALRLVLDRCGIPASQVLAIGDNYSDLPMFALAGTSVAMGNAPAAVKARATAIAPTNDEEGVAWVVQRFVYEDTP